MLMANLALVNIHLTIMDSSHLTVNSNLDRHTQDCRSDRKTIGKQDLSLVFKDNWCRCGTPMEAVSSMTSVDGLSGLLRRRAIRS